MPKFYVLCQVDAYVRYEAEVEADDAEQAAQLACDRPEDYKWVGGDAQEFDARKYVTLTAEGDEIEETYCGDLI